MYPARWVLKFCPSALCLALLVTALPAGAAPAEASGALAPSTDGREARPHEGYAALRSAYDHYRRIVASGGWPSVPDGPTLVPGELADPDRLSALAGRLAAEGDLTVRPHRFRRANSWEAPSPHADAAGSEGAAAEGTGDRVAYDIVLSEAVRRFQERHGLEVDGKVGPNTLAALNVPARERLAQIELNLERWRTVPPDLPERRIEINLPSYELVTYDAGRPSGTMRVVVGRPVSPTPTFRDRVTHVVLRPYWNVPAGITGRELVPEARENPASLAARGFEVRDGGRWVSPTAVDWSQRSGYRIRQRPGRGNSLGLVKFVLAGQTLIYLHDTPEDHAFRRPDRALSHGCVRLQRPLDLAAWLLDGEEGWSPERIRSATARGGERWVALEEEVPVYTRYFTAWTDDTGRVQFRDDVYREDPPVLRRLAERKRAAAEASGVAIGGGGR